MESALALDLEVCFDLSEDPEMSGQKTDWIAHWIVPESLPLLDACFKEEGNKVFVEEADE